MVTDVITAGVACAALVVSLFAASYSMRIARASEDSAKAARDSAEVARSVRDQNDAPEFNIIPQAPVKSVWPIEIEMLSGPPSIQVQASFIGETTKNRDGHMTGFQNRHSIQAARGTKFIVEAESIDGATHNEGRLILRSTEDGVEAPRAPWTDVRDISWDRPSPSGFVV